MWDYRLGVRQRKRKKPTRRNIAKCSATSAYSLTDLPTGGRVVLHLVIRPLLYLNVRPEPGKCNDFTSHSRNAIHAGGERSRLGAPWAKLPPNRGLARSPLGP